MLFGHTNRNVLCHMNRSVKLPLFRHCQDRLLKLGSSQKGGFQKGGFGGCYRNEGTFAKTTLLETALLSPSDPFWG